MVLTWWPVFGFGGGIWLVGLLWVCWVYSGYLVGFILFFFILGFWFRWDFVGPRVVVAGARG